MRNTQLSATLLLFAVAGSAGAHDLFVAFSKPGTAAGEANTALVNNGTFDESAGAVTRARLQDVSLSQDGAKAAPDLASWKEIGKQSQLTAQLAGRTSAGCLDDGFHQHTYGQRVGQVPGAGRLARYAGHL